MNKDDFGATVLKPEAKTPAEGAKPRNEVAPVDPAASTPTLYQPSIASKPPPAPGKSPFEPTPNVASPIDPAANTPTLYQPEIAARPAAGHGRQVTAAAAKPARSASSPAASAWRWRVIPAAPMYTAST